MRKVHIEGNKIYLNNKPYYQRLVLDQGFYPDGIWTAPSDEALKHTCIASYLIYYLSVLIYYFVFQVVQKRVFRTPCFHFLDG